MKHISIAILFCFFACGVSGQKLIEKTFSYSDNKDITLKLQIADSIKITTWNKNEVSVKASVSIAENRYNDEYIVDFNDSKDAITVNAKIESKRKNNWNEDSNCCKTDIYWEIFVPEKAPINVETINGNIVITGQTAKVQANSISGFIDLLIPADLKADFRLSTITGTVYSNVLDKESISARKGSADFTSRYKGGGTEVHLKTISGDIFLRDPAK